MARKSKIVLDYERKVEAFEAEAREFGIDQNFLFATTFSRYKTQMDVLMTLEKTIAEEDTLVTKEYVKGRGNKYVHPAITEYNKTSTAANNTAATLVKIMDTLKKENPAREKDPFMEFVNNKKSRD